MTLTEMITAYNKLSAADSYIFGFIVNHLLYYICFDGHLPESLLKLGRASSKRGGAAKVRVRASAEIKRTFIESGKAILLGSESLLDTNDKYNKGDRFERLIMETLTGEKWCKNSTPFTVAGDIELNGRQVQVKMNDAELTNENTLRRFLAA